MSVIWSGVTEEGAVVPVQVTAEGKVVAVGDGPEGDYLKLTGGNLTGDLTINTDKITLDAGNGIGDFSGDVKAGPDYDNARIRAGTLDGTAPSNIYVNGVSTTANQTALTFQRWNAVGGTNTTPFRVSWDGDATLDGDLQAVSATFAGGAFKLNGDGVIETNVNANGNIKLSSTGGFNSPKITLNAENGAATFSGDVVVGSRGQKWLIRESNGVAMLVQQTLRQPREIEKVRDLPNELDLIEAALNEIMEKLKMTPPAGWPVWDGSDNA